LPTRPTGIRWFGERSRVFYIGTTKAGARRIAESAAAQAKKFLGNHGIRQLEFYVVSCTPLQRVRTWTKLERALLLAFRQRYGAVPVGNTQGKHIKIMDEARYFNIDGLVKKLKNFESR
jgi:hypothetical protein